MSTEEKAPQVVTPMNIATISAGFEKGDFLVREEQGNRVYFDFFEEVSALSWCCVQRRSPLPTSAMFSVPHKHSHQLSQQAFNYISNRGYARMSREDEKHWVDLMNVIHDSVKGGMKYNVGTLLMVLSRPVADGKMMSAMDRSEKTTKKTPSKGGDKVLNP